MVYMGKNYFLMDDLGGKPTIFGNTHIYIYIHASWWCQVVMLFIIMTLVKSPATYGALSAKESNQAEAVGSFYINGR